ncbi:MAG: hypothetical protein ACLU80_11845 [Dorea sp.]
MVQLGLDDTSKSDYYLAYTPLGMNDWMICYIVPVKAAQKSYSFIRKYEAVFMLAFCVLVTVLIIYIVRKNSADKAELLRYTQRDALTGLYNKRYYTAVDSKYCAGRSRAACFYHFRYRLF